jgi:1-acyl-sn-glycerol-3-phosphate acyltransferase
MKSDPSIVRGGRTLFRLLLFLSTAVQGCVHFALLRFRGRLSEAERARWLHRWCSAALKRLGISVRADGAFPERGLLVSNHLSYLDILVFSALSPCVFVSKKEVLSWPLFGFMAKTAGTVFVDRERTTDAHRAKSEVSRALSNGLVVVLFPEGTSSDGTTILPFKPALFEPAVETGAHVCSAHISYRLAEGEASDVCYFGNKMSFFAHLLRLLSRGAIEARVQFSDGAMTFEDRKQAARITREQVLALAEIS